MRLMERIRQQGKWWLIGLVLFFVVSIFAGLGVGSFTFRGCAQLENRNERQAPIKSGLVEDQGLKGVMLLVNGQKIDEDRFYTYFDLVRTNMREISNDPGMYLDLFGYTARALISEEVTIQKGEELGIKVTNDEINEQKNNAIAQITSTTESSSGNILGDFAKQLGSARDRKAAFQKYLELSGLTEETWRQRVRQELFRENTRSFLQKDANDKMRAAALEKKLLVDERLAEGVEFPEVAKEFSDDQSAPTGGDIGTWVAHGLLLDNVDEAIFATPKGEMTDWIEVEIGFQRFFVYDKKEPEGEEYESEKEKTIEKIKEQEGEDYEPTEEEIAYAYERVKFYQIVLHTTDNGAANRELRELVEAAKIEINNPFVLAEQALNGDTLQPVSTTSYDDLVAIAKNTAATDDYNFGLIRTKLKESTVADKPETAEEAGEEQEDQAEIDAPAADAEEDAGSEAGTDDAPAEAEDPGAAQETEAEINDSVPQEPVPLYALAIGLIKAGIQESGDEGATFANYLIGKIYLDWLADEDHALDQPLDRKAAREEIEKELKRATDTFNYTSMVYAQRGLNLAWLDRPEEADEQLQRAQQYAPQEPGPVWDTIREAYEIIGDDDKLAALDELITTMRQEQLRRAIEDQPGFSPDNPLQIDMSDAEPVEDSGGEASGEPAADETE